MIDLHLHVLPAVDDGAGNVRESRDMLERLAGLGFTRLVATPHLMAPLSPEYHLATTRALDVIKPIAAEYGLTLSLGYEHVLTPGLARRLVEGEEATLAGSTAVMVELPFIGWPHHTGSSLFELRLAGYRPVLAHPERYVAAQSNPELVLATAQQGVVLQLTFGSFAGVYGRAAEQAAYTILERGIDRGALIVFATDAHSNGARLASVPEGMRRICQNYGQGDRIVEWATRIVPGGLLAGEPVPMFKEWLSGLNGGDLAESGTQVTRPRGIRGLRRPLEWVTRSREV